MNAKDRFHQQYPDSFFLESDSTSIEEYLNTQKWLEQGEKLFGFEKPGEGNMNFVLRIKTNHRSFILKQARPWVEKYPQIDAPIERVAIEACFFQEVENINGVGSFSPHCLRFDADNFILFIEDLGEGADYSFLYKKGENLSEDETASLVGYLSALHSWNPNGSAKGFPSNISMRKLNHEHIFHFPYLLDNGFDLDQVQSGLQEASLIFKSNAALKRQIEKLGETYLRPGSSLIHGDYYPGSWLKVANGLKVIDPEFGFIGPPEFDLGVFIAHMLMAQLGNSTVQKILSLYKKPSGFSYQLLAGFTGTEILRRLIGIAQLPLDLSLEEKQQLMEKASVWIMSKELKL